MELGDTFILVYEGMELGYYNQYSNYATGCMVQGANPSRYKKFFSSPKRDPIPALGTAWPSIQWVLGSFAGVKWPVYAKLTADLHLAL
jgi:hypothetical protein